MLDLLDRLGLRDEFPMTFMLEMGAQRERFSFADIPTDPMVAEIFVAAHDVVSFLAEHLDAYDFFFQTQSIGIATGAVYTPGEAMHDPNAEARGFPTEVDTPSWAGRSSTRVRCTGWGPRRGRSGGRRRSASIRTGWADGRSRS